MAMRICEVCGREIIGPAYLARIEGAELVVCSECVVYASSYRRLRRSERIKRATAQERAQRPMRPQRIRPSLSPRVEHAVRLELVEGFGQKIRAAREARGLTQEELGKMIGEKASVISRIEAGKMEPDIVLARKLEHALGLKLLVEVEEKARAVIKGISPRAGGGLTLGDILALSNRTSSEAEEEGR